MKKILLLLCCLTTPAFAGSNGTFSTNANKSSIDAVSYFIKACVNNDANHNEVDEWASRMHLQAIPDSQIVPSLREPDTSLYIFKTASGEEMAAFNGPDFCKLTVLEGDINVMNSELLSELKLNHIAYKNDGDKEYDIKYHKHKDIVFIDQSNKAINLVEQQQ